MYDIIIISFIMCCFNIPYTFALYQIIFDPFSEEHTDNLCQGIFRYFTYYTLLPIAIVLDIISFPFHVLNVLRRVIMGVEYSNWYYYDYLFRLRPEPIIIYHPSTESYQGLYGEDYDYN